jgi:deoxyribodipyrimidine photolyase-related protein
LKSSSRAKGALRLILGDQLSRSISSLRDIDKDTDVVLLAEVAEEATYVPHHKKKIAFLFSAMRHFADDLRSAGLTVRYVTYDEGVASFTKAVEATLKQHEFSELIVTEAAEYRVLQMQKNWVEELDIDVTLRSDDRFICSTDDFRDWAQGRSQLRMEYFYREMRKRSSYLMEGDEPAGGRWNYDSENRESLPESVSIPDRPDYRIDATTRAVLDLVADRFFDNFGDLEPFNYPVTRRQAVHYLNWFVAHALPDFGTYEDAMRQGAPFVFHSHLSALINCGLLSPRECCDKVEEAYRAGHAPLAAAEGFIRQIIGWREFVRGVYWLRMPGYGELNGLDARRALPDFFWTAETKMNCLTQAIGETRANAYAHHIQRLMVIGNFCLLAGLDPKQVQDWYLLVYHDAYEWVEMPNVVGMILYADDGFFASKPYAASGAYINRMSDYCDRCAYDVKKKGGADACPFNYLYWDFLMRNRKALARNQRLGLILGGLDRMSSERRRDIAADSARFLDSIT